MNSFSSPSAAKTSATAGLSLIFIALFWLVFAMMPPAPELRTDLLEADGHIVELYQSQFLV